MSIIWDVPFLKYGTKNYQFLTFLDDFDKFDLTANIFGVKHGIDSLHI